MKRNILYLVTLFLGSGFIKAAYAGDPGVLSVGAAAIKVAVPDVRQKDGYSCGASAFMSVCKYYNVGPAGLDDFKRSLGTNEDRGTDYRRMVRMARSLGLEAEAKVKMSLEQLEAAVL